MAIAQAPEVPVPWLQRVFSVIQATLPDSDSNSNVVISLLLHCSPLPPFRLPPLAAGSDATNFHGVSASTFAWRFCGDICMEFLRVLLIGVSEQTFALLVAEDLKAPAS